MKKTILMLAGLLALATGCDEKNMEPDPQPAADEISVSPETAGLKNIGGPVDVIVTSTGEWTLEAGGEYSWVEPSAVKGKDGDKIVFTVGPNDSEENREAVYTFYCGKAEAEFKITVEKADPLVGEISIYPSEPIEVSADGGNPSVTVTSLVNDEGASWTLTPDGEYNWVTPSAMEGEDGDVVTFNVEPNNGEEDLTATFTFRTDGDASCTCTIISKAKIWALELASEAEKEYDNKGGDLTVSVNSNIPAADLTVTVPDEAKAWIEYTTSNQGDNAVDFYFNVKENQTYENRQSTITISGAKVAPVTVAVKQKQTDILSVETKEIILGLEGGDFEIPVTANVEYELDLSDASGITSRGKDGNVERFSATSVSDKTVYNIVFRPVSSSVPAVTVPVTLKKSALINYVANMQKHYAYPTWENAVPVNNLSQFTIEMLVNIREWKSGNEISTLLGIENNFLLRMGDGNSTSHNTIQLAYNGGSKTGSYWTFSTLAGNFGHFQKWIAIALTFDKGSATLYMGQPGKTYANCGTVTIPTTEVSFGVPHIMEGKENQYPNIGKYCFWVGRSYDNNRDFRGWMSEVRIWNKVLTTGELNAENHRFYVDPASEGLVAYWRFNEDDMGKNTVKDWSASGNDLTVNSTIEYIPVSLP